MPHLLSIPNPESIPSAISGGPVGLLLEYHNLGRPFDRYREAQLLIGMCMDNRKHLRFPRNFAFTLRAGGANLRSIEFKISYAVSIAGIRSIALITHTQCGMVNLDERKDQFIQGLVDNAGWDRVSAAEHFSQFASMFEIGDEIAFALSEARRLSARYPKVQVVPLLYKVEDGCLYLVQDE